jgi:hypothetical protein
MSEHWYRAEENARLDGGTGPFGTVGSPFTSLPRDPIIDCEPSRTWRFPHGAARCTRRAAICSVNMRNDTQSASRDGIANRRRNLESVSCAVSVHAFTISTDV